MIKAFTFLDTKQSDENHHLSSLHHKLNLQNDRMHLQTKRLVYTLMQNLPNFGAESILFSKHSDTTLHFLGKAFSYSFISANTPDYSDSHISQTNPYNTLRIRLHDKLPNITTLLQLHGFPMLFFTLWISMLSSFPMLNLFFDISFKQAIMTLLIKLYKRISIKYNLKQYITLLRSIAHGFFNNLTTEMLNDL